MKTLKILLPLALILLSVTLKAQTEKNTSNIKEVSTQLQSVSNPQKNQFVIKANGKTISNEEALKAGTLQLVNGMYVYSPKGTVGQQKQVNIIETKNAANTLSDGVTVLKKVDIQEPVR